MKRHEYRWVIVLSFLFSDPVKGWTEQGHEVPNASTNPATIGGPLRARPVAPRPMALPPIDSIARPSEVMFAFDPRTGGWYIKMM